MCFSFNSQKEHLQLRSFQYVSGVPKAPLPEKPLSPNPDMSLNTPVEANKDIVPVK